MVAREGFDCTEVQFPQNLPFPPPPHTEKAERAWPLSHNSCLEPARAEQQLRSPQGQPSRGTSLPRSCLPCTRTANSLCKKRLPSSRKFRRGCLCNRIGSRAGLRARVRQASIWAALRGTGTGTKASPASPRVSGFMTLRRLCDFFNIAFSVFHVGSFLKPMPSILLKLKKKYNSSVAKCHLRSRGWG